MLVHSFITAATPLVFFGKFSTGTNSFNLVFANSKRASRLLDLAKAFCNSKHNLSSAMFEAKFDSWKKTKRQMKEKQNENKLNCSSAKDLSKVNLLPGLVYFRLMLYFILIFWHILLRLLKTNLTYCAVHV